MKKDRYRMENGFWWWFIWKADFKGENIWYNSLTEKWRWWLRNRKDGDAYVQNL